MYDGSIIRWRNHLCHNSIGAETALHVYFIYGDAPPEVGLYSVTAAYLNHLHLHLAQDATLLCRGKIFIFIATSCTTTITITTTTTTTTTITKPKYH